MNQTNKQEMVKFSSQIYTTKDYFMFKPIDGNRNKNLLHINRLKKSMGKNYLFTIIIVNEKYEIIDGQHRFDVIKELELPLNYVVCEGYGLDEVHILNQNSKTWGADDYLEGYCKLGYADYIAYREFKNTYTLGHNECITLLGGVANGGESLKRFYEGLFKVQNIFKAEETISKILMIQPYYAGVRRRVFILTMITLLKNPNFVFDEFLQKLKQQPTAMQDCPSVEMYKDLIEEIYNYRRREKINLRY